MFILRIINKEGLESNIYLGDAYNYTNRETHYEEFCRIYKVVFGIDHVADLDEMSDRFSKNCFGIISYKFGKELYPLYKDKLIFIMTEGGKTFANLTYK